jgi:hypothetical protein
MKLLIGNKCDNDSSLIVVSEEEGRDLARFHNIQFYLTSAMNNINVATAFEALAEEIVNKWIGKESQNIEKINIGMNQEPAKGCC